MILVDHARFIKKLVVSFDDIYKYEAAYEYIEYLIINDLGLGTRMFEVMDLIDWKQMKQLHTFRFAINYRYSVPLVK